MFKKSVALLLISLSFSKVYADNAQAVSTCVAVANNNTGRGFASNFTSTDFLMAAHHLIKSLMVKPVSTIIINMARKTFIFL